MRALVAISILLATAAAALAGPPNTKRTADAAAKSVNEPAPTTAPSTVPAQPAAPETAASDSTASNAIPTTQPNATADNTPRSTPAPAVPQVALRKTADDTICRKERPTGSQISIQRCYSRSSAAHRRDDEQLHSDLDYIRQQENDRQAREAAAAMKDRRTGP